MRQSSKDPIVNKIFEHIEKCEFDQVRLEFKAILEREKKKMTDLPDKSSASVRFGDILNPKPQEAKSPTMGNRLKQVRGSISGSTSTKKIDKACTLAAFQSPADTRIKNLANYYGEFAKELGSGGFKYIDNPDPVRKRRLIVQCYLNLIIELARQSRDRYTKLLVRINAKSKHEFFNLSRLKIYEHILFYKDFVRYLADLEKEAVDHGAELGKGVWDATAIKQLQEINEQCSALLVKPNLPSAHLSISFGDLLDAETVRTNIEECFKVDEKKRKLVADKFLFSHLSVLTVPEYLLKQEIVFATRFVKTPSGLVRADNSIVRKTVSEVLDVLHNGKFDTLMPSSMEELKAKEPPKPSVDVALSQEAATQLTLTGWQPQKPTASLPVLVEKDSEEDEAEVEEIKTLSLGLGTTPSG